MLGKDIPSAGTCLATKDSVNCLLGRPIKELNLSQKLRKYFLEYCCISLHVFTCCILIYTVLLEDYYPVLNFNFMLNTFHLELNI